jgi:hypothetical protein
MGLLSRSPQFVDVVFYPQIQFEDPDGNTITQASKTGLPGKARFQAITFISTGSKSQANIEGGFNTQKIYGMRPAPLLADGTPTPPMGPWSQVEWNGEKFAFSGAANVYSGSARTQHDIYFVRKY